MEANAIEEEKKLGWQVQRKDIDYEIVEIKAKQIYDIKFAPERGLEEGEEQKTRVFFEEEAELGFDNLPQDWEKFLRDIGFQKDEVRKDPKTVLEIVNFIASAELRKLLPKNKWEEKLKTIRSERILNRDPFEEYHILSEIKKGGQGTVHLVESRQSAQHLYAIKRIKDDDPSEQNTVLEFALHTECQHPNIVRVKDECFRHGGEIFILMEFMDLGDLGDLIRFQREEQVVISEGAIAYIAFNILEGLKFMHTKHRMHRDLKPLNVMLKMDGGVKLGDFGMAAQLTFERNKELELKGTPKWMAPDIFRAHQRKPYNALCDVWSLGMIVLELADVNHPYTGYSWQRIMNVLMSEAIPAPHLRNKTSSQTLREFIGRCLQKNAAERADTEELLRHQFITENMKEGRAADEYLDYLVRFVNSKRFKQKVMNFDQRQEPQKKEL